MTDPSGRAPASSALFDGLLRRAELLSLAPPPPPVPPVSAQRAAFSEMLVRDGVSVQARFELLHRAGPTAPKRARGRANAAERKRARKRGKSMGDAPAATPAPARRNRNSEGVKSGGHIVQREICVANGGGGAAAAAGGGSGGACDEPGQKTAAEDVDGVVAAAAEGGEDDDVSGEVCAMDYGLDDDDENVIETRPSPLVQNAPGSVVLVVGNGGLNPINNCRNATSQATTAVAAPSGAGNVGIEAEVETAEASPRVASDGEGSNSPARRPRPRAPGFAFSKSIEVEEIVEEEGHVPKDKAPEKKETPRPRTPAVWESAAGTGTKKADWTEAGKEDAGSDENGAQSEVQQVADLSENPLCPSKEVAPPSGGPPCQPGTPQPNLGAEAAPAQGTATLASCEGQLLIGPEPLLQETEQVSSQVPPPVTPQALDQTEGRAAVVVPFQIASLPAQLPPSKELCHPPVSSLSPTPMRTPEGPRQAPEQSTALQPAQSTGQPPEMSTRQPSVEEFRQEGAQEPGQAPILSPAHVPEFIPSLNSSQGRRGPPSPEAPKAMSQTEPMRPLLDFVEGLETAAPVPSLAPPVAPSLLSSQDEWLPRSQPQAEAPLIPLPGPLEGPVRTLSKRQSKSPVAERVLSVLQTPPKATPNGSDGISTGPSSVQAPVDATRVGSQRAPAPPSPPVFPSVRAPVVATTAPVPSSPGIVNWVRLSHGPEHTSGYTGQNSTFGQNSGSPRDCPSGALAEARRENGSAIAADHPNGGSLAPTNAIKPSSVGSPVPPSTPGAVVARSAVATPLVNLPNGRHVFPQTTGDSLEVELNAQALANSPPRALRSVSSCFSPSAHYAFTGEPGKPFCCLLCVSQLESEEAAKAHMESAHSVPRRKIKPFLKGALQCPVGNCKQVFPSSCTLVEHELAAHGIAHDQTLYDMTVQNWLCCDFCGVKTDPAAFQNHVLTHCEDGHHEEFNRCRAREGKPPVVAKPKPMASPRVLSYNG